MWKFVCIKRIAWCFGVYTSGQRYRITTTKWHLPEFDRYLLLLVVCSIAERNTVDSVDPLHNHIEWPNTVSIVWGPLRLKRRTKSQFRGSHLKWSLPSQYLDAFMQRGVSVKTIDISLNFQRGPCHKICHSKYSSELSGCRQIAILSEK